MAFGYGYTPVESLSLKEGEYRFKIMNVQEKTNTAGAYLEISLQAEKKPGYSPNKIFKRDIPQLGELKQNGNTVEQADVDRWNREMTTFFDCFAIPRGNFNFSQWRGKIGTCKVQWQYDPNEADKKSKKYKEIVPIAPEQDDTQAQPRAQQTTQAQNGAAQDFPEDIPF